MRQSLLFLTLLSFGFPLGCGKQVSDQPQLTGVTVDVFVNDIGIATFPTPEGWTPNSSDGNTAMILTRVGADPQALEEMISIDIGKAASPDAQATANALAAKFSGTVTSLPFQVDGEMAYRISIPPNHEQLMPRECVVVHRGDHACILFGGSKATADIWTPLSAVVQSWSWK